MDLNTHIMANIQGHQKVKTAKSYIHHLKGFFETGHKCHFHIYGLKSKNTLHDIYTVLMMGCLWPDLYGTDDIKATGESKKVQLITCITKT